MSQKIKKTEDFEIKSLLKKLKNLEKKTGWQFQNPGLLLESMSHASFVNEHRELKLKSNERLEFLGDAVLELVISQYLMKELPSENEGVLSLKRSALVRETTLAKLSRALRIPNYLILGRGEKRDNGHKRDSVLADAVEALIGAVYQDGGLVPAASFIHQLFSSYFEELHSVEQHFNFKNTLQQLAHKNGLGSPRYKLLEREGPKHQQKFKASVYLSNKFLSWGSGGSIKKAEQSASRNALKKLEKRGLTVH